MLFIIVESSNLHTSRDTFSVAVKVSEDQIARHPLFKLGMYNKFILS